MDADKELLNPGNDFVFKLIFGDLRNVDITRDFLSSVLNLSVQELSTLAFTNTEFLREHKTDKKGIPMHEQIHLLLEEKEENQVIKKLSETDPLKITPLESITVLCELKELSKNEEVKS